MSSLRRTIAKRLVSVKNETAMLTTFNEVDMKPVMDLRSRCTRINSKRNMALVLALCHSLPKQCV
ncbi:MAG: 2-oxo acid dehydrogenase subunit E2 [Cytophagales bacterium]|nr:2-oxo acid dehydrogenase subunit E2 [Cytophagales bacterium]